MRSLLRAALIGGLLAAACTGAPVSDSELDPAVTAAPATRTPTPGVASTPEVAAPMTELSVAEPVPSAPRPIEELAPNVAALIEESVAPIGVAVVVPETGETYVGGDTRPFALASAVKVPVMLAVLERAQSEGRELTRLEEQRIQAMITQSDNVSTTALWTELGRADGISRYLEHLDSPAFEWGAGNSWGDTAASAPELAALLAHLLDSTALGIDERATALSLLEGVALDQRWGVSAGLNLEEASGVRIGIKDGWYPQTDGWRLASTGVVRTDGGPGYAVVILTDGQPVFEDGVWTLERIAAEIHHALLPQAMTAELSLTDFPTQEPLEALVAAAAAAEATGTPSATEVSPASTPAPTPSAIVAFRPLEGAPGVLVPATAVQVAREQQDSATSFWFQVPGASVSALLRDYRLAMEQAGWSASDRGGQLVLTSGGGSVIVGAHDQPNQAVLNLVVSVPQASASAALERE